MDIVYSLLGAVCVIISVCSLLTEKYSIWEYIGLISFVTALGIWGLKAGQIVGIFMFFGVLLILLLITKKNKVENLCLASVGYLFNLLLNNSVVFCISILLHIPADIIERDYYVPFSVFYIGVQLLALGGLRAVLYKKFHLLYYIDKMNHMVQNGLLMNLIIYIVIGIFNIFWGQKAEYSIQALGFNCILFFICMLSSSWLIIVCAKNAKSEEMKKAESEKQKLMENYILCLENMIEETKAFRHDYKNMLSTMAGFIYDNQMDELKAYFDTQLNRPDHTENEEARAWQDLKNIEPMELKGFLFEKILTALSRKIDIQLEISEELDFAYNNMGDLIRLLGIFMDNAIEESEKTGGEIEVVIAKTAEGVLFRIANEYAGTIDISQIFNRGYSTKGEERGLGLHTARALIRDHSDMIHECVVEKAQFIQQLEIITEADQ